ncbi:hypothetical protein PsorP6_002765 [Peronosclerospora sorghi]|uniref:Uncharacterized protein n=1 Tax=Peronosclerospora sorghi TaxID=230839 RepID=A0ACC0VL46_9STRA|nr:hypothetical protein PsorP6_002765 [Peronosclerospora sorghi]
MEFILVPNPISPKTSKVKRWNTSSTSRGVFCATASANMSTSCPCTSAKESKDNTMLTLPRLAVGHHNAVAQQIEKHLVNVFASGEKVKLRLEHSFQMLGFCDKHHIIFPGQAEHKRVAIRRGKSVSKPVVHAWSIGYELNGVAE